MKTRTSGKTWFNRVFGRCYPTPGSEPKNWNEMVAAELKALDTGNGSLTRRERALYDKLIRLREKRQYAAQALVMKSKSVSEERKARRDMARQTIGRLMSTSRERKPQRA